MTLPAAWRERVCRGLMRVAALIAVGILSLPAAWSWSAPRPPPTPAPSEESALDAIEQAFVYQPAPRSVPPPSPQSKIRICSWNIRRFGRQHVDAQIDVMARAVSTCDLVVIQEIKNPIGSVRLWRHLQQVTRVEWGYLITPKTGRTAGETEQYVALWHPDRVQLTDSGGSAASGMAREPYYAFFGVTNPGPNAFDFMLVVTHTKPGEISTELQRLLASYRGLQLRFQQREPDLILAGDLNAGLFSTANNRTADRRFTALFGQHQIAIRQPHIPTMVQSRFVNDNLLWDTPTIEDHANSSGVAAFDTSPPFYPGSGSPLQAALKISDHRLVWVEFWTNRDSE